MSKSYKLRTHVRGHAAGDIVTEDQLKESGHDSADLLKRNALEEAPAQKTPGAQRVPTDEQNKLNVEKAIQDQTVEQGKPLTVPEQDELAAKVTKESGRPVRTDGKDIGKSEALQQKATEADRKAAEQTAPSPKAASR